MAALEHRSAVRGAHRPDLRAKKEFATVACSRSASRAILAFSAASIFRLGFFIIVSVYHDGADPTPIKPPVPKSGSTSEISEAASAQSQAELKKLREQSREIDGWDSPYKAVVSVMMLREGWDVQNVVTIVGLRPFSAQSKILPEQTLGRGLRRIFRGEPVPERVSVIGTDAFIEFVKG